MNHLQGLGRNPTFSVASVCCLSVDRWWRMMTDDGVVWCVAPGVMLTPGRQGAVSHKHYNNQRASPCSSCSSHRHTACWVSALWAVRSSRIDFNQVIANSENHFGRIWPTGILEATWIPIHKWKKKRLNLLMLKLTSSPTFWNVKSAFSYHSFSYGVYCVLTNQQ